MNSQLFTARLCAACGLLAACACASAADVNRCKDEQGNILLTDQPCAEQRMIEAVATGADGQPLAPDAQAVQAAQAVEPPKRSLWATPQHTLRRRAVSLDASTLQMARSAMAIDDEMRHQRKLASVR